MGVNPTPEVAQVDHLTKSQFCEAIVASYPQLAGADDVNLESLFDTFDEDGGGTIDFKVGMKMPTAV